MRDISAISVVIPVYRNAATLRALATELSGVLTPLMLPYELVFVVDACPEGSLDELREMAKLDTHIKVLALARNLGQNWAILAGLACAQGDVLITMDADLQDPPAAIPKLLEALHEDTGAVFAGRRGRYESGTRLLTSMAFKKTLHWLSGRRIPADAGLFVAMRKEAVDRVLAYRTRAPYLISLLGHTGLALKSIPIERPPSREGQSGYTFAKRLRVAWRALSTLAMPNGQARGAQKASTLLGQIGAELEAHITKYGAWGNESDILSHPR